ncbi:hypothetical protein [Kitasatospora viridis]|uniref:DUF11 domain-containing protein n=1 Tax=Kitasatospora viridis TaxID=281105 RepID=A0A561UAX5_9ACTN|nr:hypothetical protein [Kitasatospora viridis]TWF96518.1 hypothetical protein FHX73_11290 [Kitasatospora viridis]
MHPLLAPVLAAAVIAAGPADLRVIPMNPDPAPAGGITTVHAFVANNGPNTAGAFTITVHAPAGAHVQQPTFPGPDRCTLDDADVEVVCSFPAGLEALRSATALVPLQLDDDVSGVLRGGRVTVRSAEDPDHRNDSAPYEVRVSE